MRLSKICRDTVGGFASTITAILMLNACSSNGGKTTHGSTETVYPEDFPTLQTVSPADLRPLNIPSFGIMDFKIAKSLLFVATTQSPGLWHMYSLPSLDSIGRILNIGSGPLDIPMAMPCAMASFNTRETSEVKVGLPMSEVGKLLELRIDADNPLKDGQAAANTMYAPVGPTSIWSYTLADDVLIQAKVIPDSCKILRSVHNLLSDSLLPDNPAITELNAGKAESMADLPSILTRPVIRPDGKRVAEIPGFGSEIMIYDPFSDYFTTVRYPEVHIKDDRIKDMAMHGLSLFGSANGYEDFFAVLRNNIADNRIGESSIDFISWEGSPLGSIRFTQPDFRYFDIDIETKTLYVLCAGDDQILYLDLTDFLDSLKQISSASRAVKK